MHRRWWCTAHYDDYDDYDDYNDYNDYEDYEENNDYDDYDDYDNDYGDDYDDYDGDYDVLNLTQLLMQNSHSLLLSSFSFLLRLKCIWDIISCKCPELSKSSNKLAWKLLPSLKLTLILATKLVASGQTAQRE